MSAAARPLYVIGGGGHGRVVIDAARAMGYVVAGIFDPRLAPGSTVDDVEVQGDDELFVAPTFADAIWLNGVGANPATAARRSIFERLATIREAATLVHPKSTVASSVALAPGTQVMAGAVLQSGVQVHRNAVISTSSVVEHDCIIADHVFISPGTILCGSVTLESGVFIGAGAVILPGLTIGADAIVAAGAVVRRDVAANERYIGPEPRRQI